MFTADALKALVDTILKTAAPKHVETAEYPTVAVPSGTALVSLEPYQATRNRFRGTFRTSLVADFAKYLGARLIAAPLTDPHIFVDAAQARAVAFFNMADRGHCDDRAELSLPWTEAYKAYASLEARKFTQRQLVEWLEDWSHCLQASRDDVPMSISAAIASVRRIEVKSDRNSTSQVGEFGGRQSSLEAVEAAAQGGMTPTAFAMRFRPCEELAEVTVQLRLSIGVDAEGKPSLMLRSIGHSATVERIAENFEAVVRDNLIGAAKVFRGTFTP